MSEPVRIIVADVLAGLAQLADQSVHCCVTSPPYWGLRDYGTATWGGGDADCDHMAPPTGGRTGSTLVGTKQRDGYSGDGQYRGKCGKCGAIRIDQQIGLEPTPEAFVARMVEVFAAVRRVLRDDGTLWLNLGDSYANNRSYQVPDSKHVDVGNNMCSRVPDGLKPKDLCMIPWRVALALQADGWYLRSVIVWHKRSPMPESVTDRPTSSWEPIFLLAKSERYYFDAEAVREAGQPGSAERYRYAFSGAKEGLEKPNGGERGPPEGMREFDGSRNMRNVWTLGPEPYPEAHFATFPSEIPRRAIKAGTSERGCCPDCGAGWVRVVERVSFGKAHSNTKFDDTHNGGPLSRSRQARRAAGFEGVPSPETLRWEPGCRCRLPNTIDAVPWTPVPCVVLDPFLGSGTTIAVARELGRRGVGIELNPAYAELARIRIGKTEKPSTFQDPRIKDSPLFTEAH